MNDILILKEGDNDSKTKLENVSKNYIKFYKLLKKEGSEILPINDKLESYNQFCETLLLLL